jgi:hypothetical protein
MGDPLDELDRTIVRLIVADPSSNAEVVKVMYDKLPKYEYNRVFCRIRHRLNKLEASGVIAKNKKTKRYDLTKGISHGIAVITLIKEDKTTEELDAGDALFVPRENGTQVILLEEMSLQTHK